jgi:hypothetical protein
MERKNSLAFFRKHFRVPKKVKLQWCILVKNDNPLTKRLGILVTGTNKAIDVPQRRFIQVNIGDEDGFSAYPARKTRTRHNINYFSLDGKATLTTPESYIKDIYFRAIYSRELIEQFLI